MVPQAQRTGSADGTGAAARFSYPDGIATDSSARFEKGLYPELAPAAITRAIQLLKELCPTATVTQRFTDGAAFADLFGRVAGAPVAVLAAVPRVHSVRVAHAVRARPASQSVRSAKNSNREAMLHHLVVRLFHAVTARP